MPSVSDLELIQRLLTAAVLSALLGLEREIKQKAAGLRTNILIGVGSALFTVMSYQLGEPGTGDPARIAAQIVTGIGFLGAGAIIHRGGGRPLVGRAFGKVAARLLRKSEQALRKVKRNQPRLRREAA